MVHILLLGKTIVTYNPEVEYSIYIGVAVSSPSDRQLCTIKQQLVAELTYLVYRKVNAVVSPWTDSML